MNTGADPKRFLVNTILTAHREGGTDKLAFMRLAKNGTTIASSEQLRYITVNEGSFSTAVIVSANQSDDIGMQLTLDASGAVLASRMTFVVTEA